MQAEQRLSPAVPRFRPWPSAAITAGREVVITGVGLATPLGSDFAAFTRSLFDGGHFDIVKTRFAAPVPAACVAEDVEAGATRSERMLADRSTLLALAAGSRALDDASVCDDEMGVYVGCGAGAQHGLDQGYAQLHGAGRMSATALLRCLPGAPAGALAIRHGLRGPTLSFTSACASSAIALGEAMRAIRNGYIDIALVGGTEAPLADASVRSWQGLRVLAPAGDDPAAACRPFDLGRRGLVLGEGAAFFVLEAAEHAACRGARVHANLLGYGTAGDGHHWTEPHAEGQLRAMRAALRDARLTPDAVHAVNAHGTGTQLGDQVEAASIAALFCGADGRRDAPPPVSATKALHGHLLGAAGAIELAAVLASLQQCRLPPSANFTQRDESCPLDVVGREGRSLPEDAVILSNSFAFGGTNAALLVGAAGGRGMPRERERARPRCDAVSGFGEPLRVERHELTTP
jgi:3-oxoacyl-[acyl-carrier-protein] synthase II